MNPWISIHHVDPSIQEAVLTNPESIHHDVHADPSFQGDPSSGGVWEETHFVYFHRTYRTRPGESDLGIPAGPFARASRVVSGGAVLIR